jgi:D-alanine-D-alanine ligase-like ATP-grasp enzyme
MRIVFVGSAHPSFDRGWNTEHVRAALDEMGVENELVLLDEPTGLASHLAGGNDTIAWPVVYSIDKSGRSSLQSLLEEMGVPFIGPGGAACRYFRKLSFKEKLLKEGLPTPGYSVLDRTNLDNWSEFPAMIKADSSCNSWGVEMVRDRGELRERFEQFRDGDEAGVFIEARKGKAEYTVAYLPAFGAVPSVVAPMKMTITDSSAEFIDRQVKADDRSLAFDIPDSSTDRNLVLLTQQVVDFLELDGHCRLDIVQGDDDSLYCTDLNLVPFMNWSQSAKSYFPRAMALRGGPSYDAVLERLFCHSLHRAEAGRAWESRS